MAGNARAEEALRLFRTESDGLCGDLAALGPGDWDRPTNCPPWTVRMLIGHLVRGGESYLVSLAGALRGEPGVPEPREARAQRMNQIAAQAPAIILADLRAITDRFEREFGALNPEQLETLAAHSHGPRPARWFVEMRVAEVAFHRWDLHQSVGDPTDMDALVAVFLLPMLLEQNFPAIVARDKTGGEGSFRLAVRGRPELAWRLDFAPGAVSVFRDGQASCPVTFEGSAAALGLLIYGRQTLAELEQAGLLTVGGEREAANRFNDLFRGP